MSGYTRKARVHPPYHRGLFFSM